MQIMFAVNVKRLLGRQWCGKKRLCDKVELLRELIYLRDRLSAGGGCEVAVTTGIRCGWVMFSECGKLLYGRWIPLKLKGTVYKCYVEPAILYGNEVWCLKGS